MKLKGINRLFANLVNDINAFRMKLTLLVSQSEIINLDQFQHIKMQSQNADSEIDFPK